MNVNNIEDNWVINIQVPTNPKMPGSAARKMFDLLREYDGQTVAVFRAGVQRNLDEIGQPHHIKARRNWWRDELSYDMKKGFVELVDRDGNRWPRRG